MRNRTISATKPWDTRFANASVRYGGYMMHDGVTVGTSADELVSFGNQSLPALAGTSSGTADYATGWGTGGWWTGKNQSITWFQDAGQDSSIANLFSIEPGVQGFVLAVNILQDALPTGAQETLIHYGNSQTTGGAALQTGAYRLYESGVAVTFACRHALGSSENAILGANPTLLGGLNDQTDRNILLFLDIANDAVYFYGSGSTSAVANATLSSAGFDASAGVLPTTVDGRSLILGARTDGAGLVGQVLGVTNDSRLVRMRRVLCVKSYSDISAYVPTLSAQLQKYPRELPPVLAEMPA